MSDPVSIADILAPLMKRIAKRSGVSYNERALSTHELKTHPGPFQDVRTGLKKCEVRVDDRGFALGDILHLREWEPSAQLYSGREGRYRVTHLLRGPSWDLPKDMVVMSIEPI